MAGKEAKTTVTPEAPAAFLARVEDARKADAAALDALFQRASGYAPRMWGPAIIGYGAYAYRYESGHAGQTLAVGFSPRAGKFALYCPLSEADSARLLPLLGKHKTAKSCLYINRIYDINQNMLEQIIQASLAHIDAKWGVVPA